MCMLSGAILSGGLSTRMGEEKGLVILHGRPLIHYVMGTMRRVADEVIVSIAKGMTSRYREILDSNIKLVEDKRIGVGPLEGLARAFSSARGQYVVVSPCDTPFLKPELCTMLVESARGRDGAVPLTGAELFEPLHGVYRRKSCLESFEKAIKNGIQRPVEIYPELDLEFVPRNVLQTVDPDLTSFWNLNSYDDLELAEMKLKEGSRKL